MDNIIYMNFIEVILFFLSLGIIFYVILKEINSLKISILVTVLLAPPLLLSLEGTTQFEKAFLGPFYEEVINIEHSDMQQWYMTSLRITDASIGSLISIFKTYTYVGMTMDFNELKILAKAIHWFLGFLIIIVIYKIISQHYIIEKQKIIYSIIFFYSILLLPINILALKIFNYDLLSMLLGALAIVLLLIAIEKEDDRYAFAGIIISTLASQEKVIAGPIVFVACIIFTYIKLVKFKEISYVKSFYYSCYSIFVAFLTILTTFLIVAIIARDGLVIDFKSLFSPIIRHWGIVVRAIAGGGYGDAAAAFPMLNKLLLLFTILAVGFIPIMLINMKGWVKHSFVLGIRNRLPLINAIAIFLVFLTGILGTYLIKAFIHPYYPISEGDYFPPFTWNVIPVTTHFGAQTFFEHTISYIGHAYGIFINTIPSIYIALFIFVFWNKWYQNKELFWGFQILLLSIWGIPFLYALTSTPILTRYFNLFTLLVILIVSLEFTKILNNYNAFKKWFLLIAFVIGLTVEILPFRPVVGYFRPIWSNCCYSEALKTHHTIADGGLGWTLGGRNEEAMLIGQKLEKMINTRQIKETNVRVYCIHCGHWLDNSNDLVQILSVSNNSKQPDELPKLISNMTKSDYLVIGRTNITFGITEMFKDVKPFFTISNHGFVRAWVYRGDQLKGKKLVFYPYYFNKEN